MGCSETTESRNFFLLAGTARKTLSTRAALHARTWTEMARKAPSFWLMSSLAQRRGEFVRSDDLGCRPVSKTPHAGLGKRRPCFLAATALGEVLCECNTRPGLQERRLLPLRDPQCRLQAILRQRRVAAVLACDEFTPDAPQLGDEHAHLRVTRFAEQPRDERQRVTIAVGLHQRMSHHHGRQQSKQTNFV